MRSKHTKAYINKGEMDKPSKIAKGQFFCCLPTKRP